MGGSGRRWEWSELTGTVVPRGWSGADSPREVVKYRFPGPTPSQRFCFRVWGGSWELACKQVPPLLRRLQITLWWPGGVFLGFGLELEDPEWAGVWQVTGEGVEGVQSSWNGEKRALLEKQVELMDRWWFCVICPFESGRGRPRAALTSRRWQK